MIGWIQGSQGPEKARIDIDYNRFFLRKPNIKAKHLTPKKVHTLHQVKTKWICFFELKDFAEFVFTGDTGHQLLKCWRMSMQSKESDPSPHIWCFHYNKAQKAVCFPWNNFLQTEIPTLITYLNRLTWFQIKLWTCNWYYLQSPQPLRLK